MARRFGLLGQNIQYSKSPAIWKQIWADQGVVDCAFELIDTDKPLAILEEVKSDPSWQGIMVTTPYKELVMPYLDVLSEVATKVGAVNTIKIGKGKLIGFNTDVYGFVKSLDNHRISKGALILGSGGASKAVRYGLEMMGVATTIVSRTPHRTMIGYEDITPERLMDIDLIVNATPLGGPKMPNTAPALPYQSLTPQHILYDLSYSQQSSFLEAAPERCTKLNGEAMLLLQAEEAWRIFSGQENKKTELRY